MNAMRTIGRTLQRLLKSNPVLFVAGLLIGSVVTGALLAGSLDPPSAAVDGFGAPKSTGATYPAWDKDLPANDTGDACNSSRFTCVLGGVAVLDNETGLVWERTPSSTLRLWGTSSGSLFDCANSFTGGQWGWRLPSVHELASLLDSSVTPPLPLGHPFSNVDTTINFGYQAATTFGDNDLQNWVVTFNNTITRVSVDGKASATRLSWCVRGGSPALDRY